jgi:hypothetical protein
MVSVESMCKTLDIKLNEIPDWNCCGASIGYAQGGELPRHVMNARNIALSEKNVGNQGVVRSSWRGGGRARRNPRRPARRDRGQVALRPGCPKKPRVAGLFVLASARVRALHALGRRRVDRPLADG